MEMRKEDGEVKVHIKDFIMMTVNSPNGELTLMHPDIYNLMRTNDLHWGEFCRHFCNMPCQYDLNDGHFMCQFEMLNWFKENGMLGIKAYPKWVKELKRWKRNGAR